MKIEKVPTGKEPLYNDDYIKNRMSVMNRIVKHNNEENGNSEDPIHAKDVETVVDQLNGFIDPQQTNLKFEFHDELNEYYVTVVNPLTNEVIKEIPPKKMLDMYAAMANFMGILIDEKI
ncbi:flagellar protein FlaG [Virgibacillus sp. W0181]|uniref:flagellar protein FlaG n=1 Tax=Virgibacillus sp. W0181 TaxID=3391581 RepID=UPI003F488F0F